VEERGSRNGQAVIKAVLSRAAVTLSNSDVEPRIIEESWSGPDDCGTKLQMEPKQMKTGLLGYYLTSNACHRFRGVVLGTFAGPFLGQ